MIILAVTIGNSTMTDAPDDPHEAALDGIVDRTPVMSDPDLTEPVLLFRFIEDIAQKVHPPETLAIRYGFASPADMVAYIARNPELTKKIKQFRAIWESDHNLETRLRLHSGHALEFALPETSALMMDKTVGAAVRLDALKAHSRIAGVDGASASGKDGATGPALTFNLTFSGGRVEHIIATVVEPEVITAPSSDT